MRGSRRGSRTQISVTRSRTPHGGHESPDSRVTQGVTGVTHPRGHVLPPSYWEGGDFPARHPHHEQARFSTNEGSRP